MSKQSIREVGKDYSFVKGIESAAIFGGYKTWEIWEDFIYMAAAELSQPLDFRQDREDEYIRRAKAKKKVTHLFPQILDSLVTTLGADIDVSDVLGDAPI